MPNVERPIKQGSSQPVLLQIFDVLLGRAVALGESNPLPITSNYYQLEVAKGNIIGSSIVIIRGHNPSFDTADGFVDVAEFGDLTYLTSAEKMNIKSTSIQDDADLVGTGAWTLEISGVDNDGAAISEVVTLNGTANVLTDKLYLRINSMLILTAGSGEMNAGNITATAQNAATIQDEMDATESISQSSHYTVPLGHTLYLTRAELNAGKDGGGTQPEIEFKELRRSKVTPDAPWVQEFDKKLETAVSDELDIDFVLPIKIVAQTDLRFQANTDKNDSEVRIRQYGILVAD